MKKNLKRLLVFLMTTVCLTGYTLAYRKANADWPKPVECYGQVGDSLTTDRLKITLHRTEFITLQELCDRAGADYEQNFGTNPYERPDVPVLLAYLEVENITDQHQIFDLTEMQTSAEGLTDSYHTTEPNLDPNHTSMHVLTPGEVRTTIIPLRLTLYTLYMDLTDAEIMELNYQLVYSLYPNKVVFDLKRQAQP